MNDMIQYKHFINPNPEKENVICKAVMMYILGAKWIVLVTKTIVGQADQSPPEFKHAEFNDRLDAQRCYDREEA